MIVWVILILLIEYCVCVSFSGSVGGNYIHQMMNIRVPITVKCTDGMGAKYNVWITRNEYSFVEMRSGAYTNCKSLNSTVIMNSTHTYLSEECQYGKIPSGYTPESIMIYLTFDKTVKNISYWGELVPYCYGNAVDQTYKYNPDGGLIDRIISGLWGPSGLLGGIIIAVVILGIGGGTVVGVISRRNRGLPPEVQPSREEIITNDSLDTLSPNYRGR
jgi:hypothetical protein